MLYNWTYGRLSGVTGMNRPDKPLINCYTPDDDLVKHDRYIELELYCDQLEKQKEGLTEMVKNCHEIIERYQNPK